MRYKLLEGVVPARAADEHLLVATRPAWEKCPYIKQLTPLEATFWHGLEQGMDDETIIQEMLKVNRIKESTLRRRLGEFLKTMEAEGYLTPEEGP